MKGNEVIVNPSWIVDCLKFEKLLDYKPYLLYTNQRNDQPRIEFERNSVEADPKNSEVKQSKIDASKLSPNTIDSSSPGLVVDYFPDGFYYF